MRRVTILVLSVVVLAALFCVLCTFRARPYEEAVVDRFGSLRTPARICYGWYLKWPTDKVVLLDTRLHLYQSTLTQSATGGGDTISVRAFAAWKIVEPQNFYRSTGGANDEVVKKLIETKVTAEVGAVLAKHKLEELFNTDEGKVVTDQLENDVRDAVNAKMKGMGIEVAQVGFSRMAFPPELAASVYMRMTAERGKQATVFQSEGDALAAKIKADADSQATIARAEAERKAQEIRGQGDREALMKLAEAQTPEAMDFYRFWREIEMFKMSVGKGTILILRSDKSIADQIFQAEKPAGADVATTQPAALK